MLSEYKVQVKPFSDCCRFIIVQYNTNSTDACKKHPSIFQVYEMQPETYHGKPSYIGTRDYNKSIAFTDCGDWAIQNTSVRSALIKLYLGKYI